ncbi:hypothetical protein M3Y98_00999500 [Aphelenchoides besseyi]|nr:hypothetical protein M3Y98_00999500 [Aphelenchoides besseyi]KAI6195141.1 hypothetical protein M3Y96_01199400 [Aphelenchoides besseyi]
MHYTTIEIAQMAVSFIALILQLYIVYLILVATPRNMYEYKFFIITFTTWDIIFSLVFGLCLSPIPAEPLMGIIVRGFSYYIGEFVSRCTAPAALYAGSMVMLSQVYCLVYRLTVRRILFRVINPNQTIHQQLMSPLCKVLCFIFFQSISIAMATGFYYALIPAEVNNFLYLKQMKDYVRSYGYKPEALAKTLEYAEEGESIVVMPVSNYTTWYCCVVLISVFTVEIISATLIFQTLRTLKANSRVHSVITQKLHLQFVRLLGAQVKTKLMVLPLVFFSIPTACCVILSAIYSISIDRHTISYAYCLVSTYGVTNTLLSLFFISPYRRHCYANVIRPLLWPFAFACNGFKRPNFSSADIVQVEPTQTSQSHNTSL